MSFLPKLFFLSQFPACWASCHFHCTGFSLRSSSTAGAFTELDFCRAWPLPCKGQATVVSARLKPEKQHHMSGMFVISSVLSCCSKNLKRWVDQCYSSILLGKHRKIHPLGMRASQHKRCEQKRENAQFWLLFLCVFSSSS